MVETETPIKDRTQICDNVIFRYTGLGEPVFLHNDAKWAGEEAIRPANWHHEQLVALGNTGFDFNSGDHKDVIWKPAELLAVAEFMKLNPLVKKCSDGS